MPLNPLQLQNALLRLSTTERPVSGTEAALKLAQAYQQYAAAGSALGFPLATGGPGMAGMAAGLISAFNISPGAPPLVAQGFASMLAAFWGGAVFTGVPFPGIAAPPVATPALLASLTALLSNPANTAPVYAAQMAAALDACTRTVLVSFPQVPPAPPLVGPVL